MKSDPDTYGWDDLAAEKAGTTCWDGVRNYQARNMLRDDIRVGDGVLFYHSQTDKAVLGTARVVRSGYPDPTQFKKGAKGYDPASTRTEPRWYAVDIKREDSFRTPVTLARLKEIPGLSDMVLLRRGTRLSVMPVTAAEWKLVVRDGLG
jgi:predicted RNA-binding protein with PUA-like domain